MKTQTHLWTLPTRASYGNRSRAPLLVGCCLLFFGIAVGHAGTLVSTESPIVFFTNVASRLLKSEMDLDMAHIQIWPTNQYTPAVHRLLQVSANLYDATTNRTISGMTNGLGFPTVFRPIFTNALSSSNAPIYICGYAEVTNADMAYPGTAPLMLDPCSPADRAVFNPLTTPPPMFYGIPLVVGAKKGWPNFNEFAMQTEVRVIRQLQFFRDSANPDPNGSPIVGTNQMYRLSISNAVAAQAWNSYFTPLSRNLDIVAAGDVITVLSNETGQVLIGSSSGMTTSFGDILTTNSWPAFAGIGNPQMQASFVAPLLTNFSTLTSSEYHFLPSPQFVGTTGLFESNAPPSHFPIPRWYLALRTRLRFILVDKDANRIVDYVNLDSVQDPTQPLLDITTNLMAGGACGGSLDPADGSEWCTNRPGGSTADIIPPYGLLNQIALCMGEFGGAAAQRVDWSNFILQCPVGGDLNKSIDWFRSQLGFSPLYYSPASFYRSNVFYAPLSPTRTIFFATRWQASDPLVHYTVPDLTDLLTLWPARITTDIDPAALADFEPGNQVADRYRPWGAPQKGLPFSADTTPPTAFTMALKDPVATGAVANHPDAVGRSDDWDFPTNQSSGFGWLGRVHRGTPWQTVYLKSAGVDAGQWQKWTGLADARTAQLTQPTNDWRLASLLVPLLSTNDPRNLSSLNQPTQAAWSRLLDGFTVLTNTSYDQLGTAVMSSSSPQATAIAAALDAARRSQRGGYFRGVGDILATPALTTASPWVNTQDIDMLHSLTDEAYEMIPSQLLPLLRPDSIASIIPNSSSVQVQFTGFDAWRYAVETSPNLADWTAVVTNNYPSNGVFNFTDAPASNSGSRFYRSVLLP